MIECPVCHWMIADAVLIAVHLYECHQVVTFGWLNRTWDCAWCGLPLIGVAALINACQVIDDCGCGLLAQHLEQHGGAQAHYAASLLGINPGGYRNVGEHSL